MSASAGDRKQTIGSQQTQTPGTPVAALGTTSVSNVLGHLGSEFNALAQRAHSAEALATQLRAALEQANITIQELNRRVVETDARLKTTESEKASEQKANAELKRDLEKAGMLAQHLADRDARIAKVELEKNELASRITRMKRKIDELAGAHTEDTIKNGELALRVQALEIALERSRHELAELMTRSEKDAVKAADQINTLTAERDRAIAANLNINKDHSLANALLDAHRTSYAKALEEFKAAKTELVTVKRTLSTKDAELRQVVEAAKAERARFEAHIAKVRAEIIARETSLNEAQAKIDDAINLAQNERLLKEQSIADWKHAVAECGRTKTERNAIAAERDKALAARDKALAERDAAQAQYDRATAEVEKLHGDCTKLRNELSEMALRIEENDKVVDALNAELSKFEAASRGRTWAINN